jgi:hypothetical protein
MNLQNTYDLWQAGKNVDLSKIKVFPTVKGRPDEATVLKKYISNR